MSHFTTLIIVDGSEPTAEAAATVAEQMLAPFDENTEVEPYRSYEDGAPDDFWWSSNGRELGLLTTGATWQQVADAYAKHYGKDDDDDRYQVDELGMYRVSTYNPRSKWDWYALGGRWTGFFRVEAGAAALVGQPGAFGNQPSAGTADAVRKYDIDFDGMHLEALGKAGAALESFKAIVAQVRAEPETYRSWVSVRESSASIEEARETFAAQPIVAAWRKINPWNSPDDFFFDQEDWEKRYLRAAIAQATSTFAVLDSEGWREKGSMGWFGMVAEEKDGLDWATQVNRMIENLPDDAWLLVYDLHI